MDIQVRTARIATHMASHEEACEMEHDIRRLVSASGGTEWEYNVRAGKVSVT